MVVQNPFRLSVAVVAAFFVAAALTPAGATHGRSDIPKPIYCSDYFKPKCVGGKLMDGDTKNSVLFNFLQYGFPHEQMVRWMNFKHLARFAAVATKMELEPAVAAPPSVPFQETVAGFEEFVTQFAIDNAFEVNFGEFGYCCACDPDFAGEHCAERTCHTREGLKSIYMYCTDEVKVSLVDLHLHDALNAYYGQPWVAAVPGAVQKLKDITNNWKDKGAGSGDGKAIKLSDHVDNHFSACYERGMAEVHRPDPEHPHRPAKLCNGHHFVTPDRDRYTCRKPRCGRGRREVNHATPKEDIFKLVLSALSELADINLISTGLMHDVTAGVIPTYEDEYAMMDVKAAGPAGGNGGKDDTGKEKGPKGKEFESELFEDVEVILRHFGKALVENFVLMFGTMEGDPNEYCCVCDNAFGEGCANPTCRKSGGMDTCIHCTPGVTIGTDGHIDVAAVVDQVLTAAGVELDWDYGVLAFYKGIVHGFLSMYLPGGTFELPPIPIGDRCLCEVEQLLGGIASGHGGASGYGPNYFNPDVTGPKHCANSNHVGTSPQQCVVAPGGGPGGKTMGGLF